MPHKSTTDTDTTNRTVCPPFFGLLWLLFSVVLLPRRLGIESRNRSKVYKRHHHRRYVKMSRGLCLRHSSVLVKVSEFSQCWAEGAAGGGARQKCGWVIAVESYGPPQTDSVIVSSSATQREWFVVLGERGRIANCGQINKLKCVGDEMLKSSGDKGVVNVE